MILCWPTSRCEPINSLSIVIRDTIIQASGGRSEIITFWLIGRLKEVWAFDLRRLSTKWSERILQFTSFVRHQNWSRLINLSKNSSQIGIATLYANNVWEIMASSQNLCAHFYCMLQISFDKWSYNKFATSRWMNHFSTITFPSENKFMQQC